MNMDLEEFKILVSRIEEITYIDQKTGKSANYSQPILKIIQRLSDPDHYSRLNIIDVYRWLLPYQKSIIDFEPFKLRINSDNNAR